MAVYLNGNKIALNIDNVEVIKNYGYQIETKYEVDERGNKTQVWNIYEGIDPDEYKPNADMVWARQVCENDVQEGFTSKVLQMIGDLSPTSTIRIPFNGAVKTSDGVYYTYANNSSPIEHTWNDTNARISESYQGLYNKVRWVIYYFTSNVFNSSSVSLLDNSVYRCFSGLEVRDIDGGVGTSYLLEYVDFINGSILNGTRGIIQYCSCLKALPKTVSINISNMEYAFGSCYVLQSIPELNISSASTMDRAFSSCYSLKEIPQLDTSNITNMNSSFNSCYSLKEIPQLDTSKVTDMYQLFYYCTSLRATPELDLSNAENVSMMFYNCHSLQKISLLNMNKATSVSNMFYNCYSLVEISGLNTSNSENLSSLFGGCRSLKEVPLLDTSNATQISSIFSNCVSLKTIPQLNTSNVTRMDNAFSHCQNLETIEGLDLINVTYAYSIFQNCYNLTNLTLKNIKISLIIGSASSGSLLTLDSLTNTIKELWDNTSGTSTLTLTVGSANLEKLANVYVKLIDITDEMRAEDEYIDNKKPFVVCESTDEGAMLISEYVTSKNWQLA